MDRYILSGRFTCFFPSDDGSQEGINNMCASERERERKGGRKGDGKHTLGVGGIELK